MINLNELTKITYENASKREHNGGHIKANTRSMLKHCATEVVEATEAYNHYCYADWHCGSPDEKADCIGLTPKEAKSHFTSELADIICCVLIIAGNEGIDIEKSILDCVEKNRKRAEGTGDKL